MTDLEFIYKRHSIRKFKDEGVPMDDIKEMIRAAEYAPSGKNLQNWHFIIIKKDSVKEGVTKVIEKRNLEIAANIKDEKVKESFAKALRFQTFVKDAPVLVLVYAGPYPVSGHEALKSMGASQAIIDDLLRPTPGIQNIGAAMENFMLAAANMGYGTCWMTGPNYAALEISEYIGFEKEGYYLAAMTPLGVPESMEFKRPPRKPIDEIMTIIE
ncbi:MAG: nitroreductase family protein [Clostridiales bacterium]|jgi:nitroreductase|nr:nitroreductase family protein [Clostridiales bacterium]